MKKSLNSLVTLVCLCAIIAAMTGASRRGRNFRHHRRENPPVRQAAKLDKLELFTVPLALDADAQKLELVKIPAGSFTMGSPEDEIGRFKDEREHQVTLTRAYWIGKYEVTQEQWLAVMEQDPSFFIGRNQPVENISWIEAKLFCDKLNELYGDKLPDGYRFDLPTEAQWEYACRAGTHTALNSGNNLTKRTGHCSNMNVVGWYGKNSPGKVQPVGGKMPNAWGLYDMHGNVIEWCRDWYASYPKGDSIDPAGPKTGAERVCRGAGLQRPARYCRSAFRSKFLQEIHNYYLGFRLAIVPAAPSDKAESNSDAE